VIDAGLLDPLVHGTRALELTDDTAFLAAMVRAELSLSRAFVDAGAAPKWMLAVCDELAAGALDAIELVATSQASRAGGNPVIPLVRQLRASADLVRAGASDHVHVGATSQDILDTAAMLVARDVCDEVLTRIRTLGDSLASLAETHRRTPMIGRTLGQHASPTTFGFVAAGWLDGVTAAILGLERTRAALPLQLGGAVGDLSVLASVADARGSGVEAISSALSERLGLRLPPISWHGNRAPVLDLASSLAAAAMAVGVVALDVTVLARTEIAEVAEGAGGGSSAMPHKHNPVAAVLVTAAARRAPHTLSVLYSSALSEDQRSSGAWHAEWLPLRELERLAVAAASGASDLVSNLRVDSSRMEQNMSITEGLVFSERISAALAETMGRTAAFELVERASVEAERSSRPLQAVVAELAAHSGYDPGLRDAVWAAFGRADGQGGVAAIDRSIAAFRAVSPADSGGEQS